MAYKINEDLYIGNTNKQLKDLLKGDALPIGAITEFDGVTIPEGYEEVSEMSGSNANGSWIKFADGTMICTKKVTGQAKITATWGNLYDTGDNPLDLGDWPIPFIDVPIVSISFYGANGQWVEGFQTSTTKEKVGKITIASATSKTANSYYNIIGIGRWK